MIAVVSYPNRAPYAMQAHRLWIKLWISLGHLAENRRQPGGNALVAGRENAPAHSLRAPHAQPRHSACAWLRRPSPARTWVIPRVHSPYDDYQTSYVSDTNPK
jgi:hypothetical protein